MSDRYGYIAIEALLNFCENSKDHAVTPNDFMRMQRVRVPERKTGWWIHREDMDFLDENKVEHIHFMCSECGLIHDFLDWHTAQYNYCPNCGARMEVDAWKSR